MKYEKIRLKLRRKYMNATKNLRRRIIKNEDFTIIANNCWAGFIYQSYGLKYNTPTIGLYFLAEDYIKFVYNIKEYLSYELEFIDPKDTRNTYIKKELLTYPIGKLKDIEIHFMHYKTQQEAKEKWTRRCERINWNKILFKFSNQNMCTKEHIEQFMNLPVKNKVCFVNKKFNVDGVIYIRQFVKSENIRASYEPFGGSRKININKLINNL